MTKQKVRKIKIYTYLVLATAIATAIATGLFFERYKLQSPILIQLQSPVVERQLISPIAAEAKEVVNNDTGGTKEALRGEDKVDTRTSMEQSFKRWDDYSTEEKIKMVFGQYSDDALLLLMGKGSETCAENRGLATDAININSDGSRDYGVFQINDNWHGYSRVQNNTRYLLDEDVNIFMAKKLHQVSGNSFKLWTCGNVYGI